MSESNGDTTPVDDALDELAEAVEQEEQAMDDAAENVTDNADVEAAADAVVDAAEDAGETITEQVEAEVNRNPDLSDEHIDSVTSRVIENLRAQGHIPSEETVSVEPAAADEPAPEPAPEVTPQSSHWAFRPLFTRRAK